MSAVPPAGLVPPQGRDGAGEEQVCQGEGSTWRLQGDKGERGGIPGSPLMPFLRKQERDMIFSSTIICKII